MTNPLLTFTGIDAKTSVNFMKTVSRKYAKLDGYRAVEFAILRSPHVGQSPRYPGRETIKNITNYIYPQHLAFHLCGRYARMVHQLEWGELCDIIDFEDVGRVQVNSEQCDDKAIVTLQRFSMHIGKPVIMQWRETTFPYVAGVQLLQDRSGGKGELPNSWARPSDLCRKAGHQASIGYAGGLNPDNFMEQAKAIIKAARGKPFWMDCESGVRTDDWFDITKAQAMIDMVAIEAGRLAVDK